MQQGAWGKEEKCTDVLRLASSALVKVCGCRPHDGGAAHTGAGVRKPPREETAGGVERVRVRRYGDLVGGGSLPVGDRLCGERSKSGEPDRPNAIAGTDVRAAKIDRRVGYPGRCDGEHDHGRSRRGEAEAPWNGAANGFWS